MRTARMPGSSGRILSAIQNEFKLPRGSRNSEQEKIDSDFAGLLYRALIYINLTEFKSEINFLFAPFQDYHLVQGEGLHNLYP